MTTPDPRDDAGLKWIALAWALACFAMVRMME
jgi:hypothetical protein